MHLVEWKEKDINAERHPTFYSFSPGLGLPV